MLNTADSARFGLTCHQLTPSLRAPRCEVDGLFHPGKPICFAPQWAAQVTNNKHKKRMKTFSAKAQDVERKWYVIDAQNKVLGQVAVEAANLLRGKNKTIFTLHVDTGDFVIITNAEKVVLTGNKEGEKIYTRYTGYVGNQKVETPKQVRARRPELLLERAIRGMVPHNKLGDAIFKKLKVVVGSDHSHDAQQPEVHEIK